MVARIVLLSINTLRTAFYAKQLIPPPFEEENVMTYTECNDKNEYLILIFFILDLILVTLSLLN